MPKLATETEVEARTDPSKDRVRLRLGDGLGLDGLVEDAFSGGAHRRLDGAIADLLLRLEIAERFSGAQGAAQVGGFDTQLVGANAPKRLVDNGPVTTPVNITYKPSPTYTQEARNLQLQGEVLLEVVFAANGQLHVNRVVRGLGHGLDEAAVSAANKIQFKPALREGSPIDSTAVVHVVFELAM